MKAFNNNTVSCKKLSRLQFSDANALKPKKEKHVSFALLNFFVVVC